jgi:hypothetical protein
MMGGCVDTEKGWLSPEAIVCYDVKGNTQIPDRRPASVKRDIEARLNAFVVRFR